MKNYYAEYTNCKIILYICTTSKQWALVNEGYY